MTGTITVVIQAPVERVRVRQLYREVDEAPSKLIEEVIVQPGDTATFYVDENVYLQVTRARDG